MFEIRGNFVNKIYTMSAELHLNNYVKSMWVYFLKR